mgnify:CR=1 FL=1
MKTNKHDKKCERPLGKGYSPDCAECMRLQKNADRILHEIAEDMGGLVSVQ